jgi:hypothetical protein
LQAFTLSRSSLAALNGKKELTDCSASHLFEKSGEAGQDC